MREGCQIDDAIEGELSQTDGNGESKDINSENWFFGNSRVRVENKGDKESKNKKTCELGGEIIGVFAVDIAIHEPPKKRGGDGDFDMFPGGFVDGGKEAEGFGAFHNIVEKMGEATNRKDGDDANPSEQNLIHITIVIQEKIWFML